MNRCLAAIGSGFLVLVASVLSAHAVTITYGAPGSETPAFAGASVLNFDAVPLGPLGSYNFGDGTLTGGGAVVSGSLVNRYAAPAGDSTRYLTVAYGAPVGSATLLFINPENYFGLYWGSIDSYNSITFELDGQTIATYTGSQLPAPVQANGDQQSPLSNRYVNFFFGAQFFDEVVLHTTNYAFESDNIAYADPPVPVPEPGTLVSLLGALAGMGMWSWLRNRERTRSRALASQSVTSTDHISPC